jgi:hypothetical protein
VTEELKDCSEPGARIAVYVGRKQSIALSAVKLDV